MRPERDIRPGPIIYVEGYESMYYVTLLTPLFASY